MAKAHKQIWSNRTSAEPAKENIAYCSGRDVSSKPMVDAILIPYDIWNNEAHSMMLHQQKILSRQQLCAILTSLANLTELSKDGKVKLNSDYEDIHTYIETFVTKAVGMDAGGWMHTGRSRNDQTTTDIRLYMRDKLLSLCKDVVCLVQVILKTAQEHVETIIPGFTHYQPASLTTYGHWLASYAQALIRDLERFVFSFDFINKNPLGAVAAFGTPWNIDRQLTTHYFGFDEIQENSLDCVTNRWEMEAQVGCAVSFLMLHMSIMSQDFLFLSSPPLGLIRIHDKYVTGSSIMPHKRNPDFAEVTKAKATIVSNLTNSLWGIAKSALSGYNRDSQWTKYLIVDIFDEVELAPTVFSGVFQTMQVNKEKMAAMGKQNFIDASIIADYISSTRNKPFRMCYNAIAEAVKLSEKSGSLDLKIVNTVLKGMKCREFLSQVEWNKLSDPLKMVSQKKHAGGPAPETVSLHIESLSQKLQHLAKEFRQREGKVKSAQKQLARARKKFLKERCKSTKGTTCRAKS